MSGFVAHYKLSAVLAHLNKSLRRTEQLAANAHLWSMARFPKGLPRFTVQHKNMVTELAFLRAFIAWEAFLEESFVLYLWGKDPPRGNAPQRHAFPSNRKHAERLAFEGKAYADWTVLGEVATRAERFFRGGRPYSQVLKSRQNRFGDMKTIRNAIVHSSGHSETQFKRLVRRKLQTCPPSMTVARFLDMTIPQSSPPESFLESYVAEMRFAAERIVPS